MQARSRASELTPFPLAARERQARQKAADRLSLRRPEASSLAAAHGPRRTCYRHHLTEVRGRTCHYPCLLSTVAIGATTPRRPLPPCRQSLATSEWPHVAHQASLPRHRQSGTATAAVVPPAAGQAALRGLPSSEDQVGRVRAARG